MTQPKFTKPQIFSALSKLQHIYRIIEVFNKFGKYWQLAINSETLENMEGPDIYMQFSSAPNNITSSRAVIERLRDEYHTSFKTKSYDHNVYGEVVRYTLAMECPKIIIDFVKGIK